MSGAATRGLVEPHRGASGVGAAGPGARGPGARGPGARGPGSAGPGAGQPAPGRQPAQRRPPERPAARPGAVLSAALSAAVALLVTLAALPSCGRHTGPGAPGAEGRTDADAIIADNPLCPAIVDDLVVPDVAPHHRDLTWWLTQLGSQLDLDEVLLDATALVAHSASLNTAGGPDAAPPVLDLTRTIDRALIAREVRERLAFLHERAADARYVEIDGAPMAADQLALLDPERRPAHQQDGEPARHIARGLIPVRCGPRAAGFYTPSLDLNFDRNNCSTLHAGEPLVVVAREPGGMLLVRAAWTMGWIADDAPLSPAIDEEGFAAYVRAPVRALAQPLPVDEGLTIPPGTLVRVVPGAGSSSTGPEVLVPGADGIRALRVGAEALETARPLTRRAVLEVAFRMLDEPYGWGGQGGHRDCSRYLMDVFGELGLRLPRTSVQQAEAGTFVLDVGDVEESQKALLIDQAHEHGVVLLHMHGHIMLYLGRDEGGRPMALHSFAEYVTPCPDGELNSAGVGETLHRVGRVDVSDLELGRDTSRRSFIERIHKITVIGRPPGAALRGVARVRTPAPVVVPPADQCSDSEHDALFTVPLHPWRGAPLRAIATSTHDPGPVELVLVDPDGVEHRPEPARLGGPPFTLSAQVEQPAPGVWTVVLGDGPRVVSCQRVRVRSERVRVAGGGSRVWQVRNAWSPRFENLYAAFVEQLFAYPQDDDRTWTNLHDVLDVPEMNLLWGYYNVDEEQSLRLVPDCADLPYTLRAYFAWKMGLPFGYRRCNRGREGRPPSCGALETQDQERVHAGNAAEFNRFARQVMSAVHSGSARTVPQDEASDLYPVPLTREALRPGITFVDPDGHLLVIAGWIEQPLEGWGVLYAADAQPDGTIARRTFWRGTFLFRPETHSVGAGFKAFRPIVFDRREQVFVAVDNDTLRRSELYPPWSDEQNRMDVDGFYERMDELINPRPLDPYGALDALIAALEQSVSQRVIAIRNGSDYMNRTSWRTVAMPSGYSIFETSGPWEDFSTPSRDMRLLIAIDTVARFVDRVRRRPAQYGIHDPDELETVVAALEAYRDEELGRRTVRYVRTDGSEWPLSLADVLARAERFELAWNPNDCPEHRWGALPDTDESRTCRSRAPSDQQARMAEYHGWFRDRQRPAR